MSWENADYSVGMAVATISNYEEESLPSSVLGVVDYSLFTITQQKVLGYVGVFFALLSMIGSSAVIYTILSKEIFKSVSSNNNNNMTSPTASAGAGTGTAGGRRTFQRRDSMSNTSSTSDRQYGPYERIMLVIGITDFIGSFAMVAFGPWAMPYESNEYIYGATGSFTTCSVAGFLLNFGLITIWYSFFLALYFLLLIRYEWSKNKIAKYIEPVVHCFALIITICIGYIATFTDWMNPLYLFPGVCYLGDFPPGCSYDDNVECQRGGAIRKQLKYMIPINLSVGAWAMVLVFVGIFICMILLVAKVYSTEKRLLRYYFNHNQNNNSNSIERSNGTAVESNTTQATAECNNTYKLVRTRQAGIRALMYIASFFLVWAPVVILLTLSWNTDRPRTTEQNRRLFFIVAMLCKILTPCKGLFNAIVFQYKRLGEFHQIRNILSLRRMVRRIGSNVVRNVVLEGSRLTRTFSGLYSRNENSAPMTDDNTTDAIITVGKEEEESDDCFSSTPKSITSTDIKFLKEEDDDEEESKQQQQLNYQVSWSIPAASPQDDDNINDTTRMTTTTTTTTITTTTTTMTLYPTV